ncbi:MAG: hypothetical protein PVG99_16145, partial [Desulfobacteraceae bacterium]
MNDRRSWIPLIVLGMFLASPSCGKKGPPFLPQKAFDIGVEDLQGEWTEGYALLKGNVRGHEEPKRLVKGSRVYYAQYPLDKPPCEGCPIEYQGYRDLGPEVMTETGFSCKVPARMRGQVYFFKVHLVGKDGVLGPPSKTVQVTV